MSPTLDQARREALVDAIRAVEARSSAEVVIAMRARTGGYLHVCLATGAAFGLAILAFLLFSPWEFSLLSIQILPALGGAAVAVATGILPPALRLLTGKKAMEARVLQAARATFVDRRVHQTKGRTGVLVYVSWIERQAVVVPDVGIEAQVPATRWAEGVAGVQGVVARGRRDVAALARSIAALGDVLEGPLPRAADDVNELPDEVAVA